MPNTLMDIDKTADDANNIHPSTPDSITFDQTINDEVCVSNAIVQK